MHRQCCLPCTYSIQQSPSWEANRFSASQEIPRILGNKGSLPHSQVPATCLYPEPVRSSPYPHTLLPEDPSYPPIYAWVSQVVSFLQVSSPKRCIRLSFPPYALHAQPISFFSILSPEPHCRLPCILIICNSLIMTC